MVVSVFSPNPLSWRTRCASQAARSWSSVSIFNSRCRIAARLGPRPGTRSTSSRLAGISARSSLSIGNSPESSSVPIFSARSLPMPSRSVSLRRIGRDIGERFGQFADGAGRVAIRPDAKLVGALHLQQIGDLFKRGGNFDVGHLGPFPARGVCSRSRRNTSPKRKRGTNDGRSPCRGPSLALRASVGTGGVNGCRCFTCAAPPRLCRAARSRL